MWQGGTRKKIVWLISIGVILIIKSGFLDEWEDWAQAIFMLIIGVSCPLLIGFALLDKVDEDENNNNYKKGRKTKKLNNYG